MIKLSGNKKEALRYLGYRGQQISPETERQLDLALTEGLNLAVPLSSYMIFDAEETDDGLKLENTDLILTGKNINAHLHGASKCAVMAVTVGLRIEMEINRYEKSGEMTRALMLDCVATALVEELADRVNDEIEKIASENGFYCKSRFSPGYGDFPIETQKKIIPLLNCERRLGITLSDNCFMSPRKSVTAVIGFFEREGKQNEA